MSDPELESNAINNQCAQCGALPGERCWHTAVAPHRQWQGESHPNRHKQRYVPAHPPPIYDEIYEEGVAALNGDILTDRLSDLRMWATNRLACCHAALTGRTGELSEIEVARYEQEQRTLQAVMRQLSGGPTP